jgi:hypothetical protein
MEIKYSFKQVYSGESFNVQFNIRSVVCKDGKVRLGVAQSSNVGFRVSHANSKRKFLDTRFHKRKFRVDYLVLAGIIQNFVWNWF